MVGGRHIRPSFDRFRNEADQESESITIPISHHHRLDRFRNEADQEIETIPFSHHHIQHLNQNNLWNHHHHHKKYTPNHLKSHIPKPVKIHANEYENEESLGATMPNAQLTGQVKFQYF